ncbi:MAG: hypothetical protein E2O29_01945 [Deltaproteobacteria bacterium]|nr:MAG: hypothetical protein E2O29_01945 [Deltaproteobacteria bacterium]
MASSLLFRISSKFDASGFNAAKAGFKGVIGTGLKLAGVLASIAFSAQTLGIAAGIFLVSSIAKAAVGFTKTNQQAISAEASFVRLRTQLRLVGEESEKSAALITRGAEQTARTTRFSVQDVQRATTIALQSTRDLEKAQKTVIVAQDVAAATGRDLTTTTRILNLAQKGNIRVLLQLTDLRRADIKAAIRQGTLLDKLAEKFGGAAADETDTLASKLQILANVQDELDKETGKTGLAFNKFTTDIAIASNVINLKFTRAIKGATKALISGEGTIGIAQALVNAFKNQDVDDAIGSTTSKIFDFNKALELQSLRLGKTRIERQQLARDVTKADALLLQAQRAGLSTLTAEQLEFGNQFRFFQQGIRDEIRATTETEEDTFKERQKRLKELQREKGADGITGIFGDIAQQFKDFRQGGLTATEAIKQIGEDFFALIKQQLESNKLITKSFDEFLAVDGAITDADISLSKFKGRLDGILKLGSEIGDFLGGAIEAALKPLSNVIVNLSISSEDIKEATREGAQAAVNTKLNNIRREATNAGREERAQDTFG